MTDHVDLTSRVHVFDLTWRVHLLSERWQCLDIHVFTDQEYFNYFFAYFVSILLYMSCNVYEYRQARIQEFFRGGVEVHSFPVTPSPPFPPKKPFWLENFSSR